MIADFVPGIELARSFYTDVVRPILGDRPHSAALLGEGSEVLGFDTARSTDHNWGPRLQLFVPSPMPELGTELAQRLPATYRGFPTVFPLTHRPDVPAQHWVVVTEYEPWIRALLGFDPRDGVRRSDWLATPTQRFAEYTAGAVYHDGLAVLTSTRAALTWYPDDVWRYVVACQWHRIAQEEAFPGRCAEVGDELGSVVVTSRLVRDLMRLCLLLHRVYPPYSKWFGSAFARLDQQELADDLRAAVTGADWPTRQARLSMAYENVAAQHNEVFGSDVDIHVRPYFGRPFQVLEADRFARAVWPGGELIGAIDQYVDSTDALGEETLRRRAARYVVGQHGDIHSGR